MIGRIKRTSELLKRLSKVTTQKANLQILEQAFINKLAYGYIAFVES